MARATVVLPEPEPPTTPMVRGRRITGPAPRGRRPGRARAAWRAPGGARWRSRRRAPRTEPLVDDDPHLAGERHRGSAPARRWRGPASGRSPGAPLGGGVRHVVVEAPRRAAEQG